MHVMDGRYAALIAAPHEAPEETILMANFGTPGVANLCLEVIQEQIAQGNLMVSYSYQVAMVTVSPPKPSMEAQLAEALRKVNSLLQDISNDCFKRGVPMPLARAANDLANNSIDPALSAWDAAQEGKSDG